MHHLDECRILQDSFCYQYAYRSVDYEIKGRADKSGTLKDLPVDIRCVTNAPAF